MSFEHIESLSGSPQPNDIFEPYMPGVDLLSDMDGFFSKSREMLEAKNINEFIQAAGFHRFIHQESLGNTFSMGQRHVAIITPGRMIMLAPAPTPNSKSENELTPIRKLLPSGMPLQITAISYTKLEALTKDTSKTKCIPFLGFLLAFAYLGHNVMVFEGHSSALEAGVRNSDVLLIDSGMLPFLPENWADTVFKVMKPNQRIFVHDRDNYMLVPIVKKNAPPGWQYTAPNDEASYANVLLTTIAKTKDKNQTVRLISGQSLPNPKEFTTDPDELEYISILPFTYEELDTDLVIKIIWDYGQAMSIMDKIKSTKVFNAKLALSANEAADVSFQLKLSKTSNGKQQLELKLLRAG
jgi:hypothetical protein